MLRGEKLSYWRNFDCLHTPNPVVAMFPSAVRLCAVTVPLQLLSDLAGNEVGFGHIDLKWLAGLFPSTDPLDFAPV